MNLGKRQQLLLALICLTLSYISGTGLYLLVKSDDTPPARRVIQSPRQKQVERAVEAVREAEYGPGSLGPAYNFTLLDESGVERSFEDIHQGRPALLYFFIAGCDNCSKRLQNIGPLISQVKERGFSVVGVQYGGTPDQGRQFRDQYGLPSPIMGDREADTCSRFGVGEFTVILVGADNNVYFRDLMNGSNWPGLSAIEKTLALGGEPAPARMCRTPQTLPDPLSKPETEPLPSLLNTESQNRSLFDPVQLGLIALILIGTLSGLAIAKENWLHLLAASELLLMGVVWDVWLYWPANLFLISAAALMLVRQKWILGLAASAGLLTLGFMLRPVFDESLVPKVEQLQQSAHVWRFAPQVILSLIMFRLGFTAEKQVYEKVAIAGTGDLDTTPAHDGVLAIRGISVPERCDVCHQNDQFDAQTGFCSRCNRKTL